METNVNQIQKVFEYQGGHKVRTVIIDGEPWFVAKDVCEVLGCKGNNVTNWLNKLPSKMKGLNLINTLKGLQKLNCVNEPGLYKLVMRSDKPEAQEFQNWVASEVLPSIRKHGMYMTPQVAQEAIEDTDAFLARALLIAKDKLDKLEAEVKELKPKAQHFDEYMDYKGTHSFTDVAALLGIHVTVFTAQMVADGILRRNIKGELYPRKAYQNTPYFKVKHTPKYIQTRVTPEGVQWLTSRYSNNTSFKIMNKDNVS